MLFELNSLNNGGYERQLHRTGRCFRGTVRPDEYQAFVSRSSTELHKVVQISEDVESLRVQFGDVIVVKQKGAGIKAEDKAASSVIQVPCFQPATTVGNLILEDY